MYYKIHINTLLIKLYLLWALVNLVSFHCRINEFLIETAFLKNINKVCGKKLYY